MKQGNKKDPYEFMITKHEFYGTAYSCTGILIAYQCSLHTLSDKVFEFCWFYITVSSIYIMWSWIKSLLDWIKYGND